MDILDTLGVTIEAKYIPHDTPAGKTPTLRWSVAVRRNGRTFRTIEYFAGCAHSPEHKKAGRVTPAVVAECETGILYGTSRPVPPPSAKEVFWCLLSDARGTDESFEDWATEYGFDPDSRKAEKDFNECRETAAALRRTFDRDELEALEAAFVDY